jgi:adenine-specific DNA-methyltransferase
VDDAGELVLAAVQDRAWKIDRDLVKLLLSDKEIKAKFFEEIEGYWIFNINTFIDYISQKNFLDNSYTRFRNRIGLTIGGKYLRERGEVALVWPYKDCVLEGGQTKEEEKRKEIFFNEVLAQDEINRLLDPKVLTNFTRYTVNGKEKVTDFKRDENGVIRENLIIKGNNLLALHTLKTQFRGQVKLIYIDPPYNTGNDSFGYNDSFNHSTWLTFMKNRLEVARELLRQDGSIWINIDDNEAHYLKVLCDEVYGRENFVANVIWQKKYTIANDARYFSDNHDHILVFAKSKLNFHVNGLPRTETQEARYSNPDNDPRGPWMTQPLHAKSGTTKGFKYTFKSGVEWEPPRGTYPRYTKESLQKLEEEGRIWFGVAGNAVPRVKKYLSEMSSVTPATLWLHTEAGNNDNARREVLDLIEDEEFLTPKPEKLLQRILQIGSNEGDIVLDFVAGSATTGAVSLKMNRQFILSEQMDYSESITLERIKKVIAGDQGGISKSVNWQGGGDFVYCELMKYNEAFMERIQAAKSSEELMQIWCEMAENSFLNWYVNPAMPEEAVNDFIALGKEPNGLEKQKHLLAELLDKNQLYVNLSEIDDAQFQVSKEDKALNKAFYGEAYNA